MSSGWTVDRWGSTRLWLRNDYLKVVDGDLARPEDERIDARQPGVFEEMGDREEAVDGAFGAIGASRHDSRFVYCVIAVWMVLEIIFF